MVFCCCCNDVDCSGNPIVINVCAAAVVLVIGVSYWYVFCVTAVWEREGIQRGLS